MARNLLDLAKSLEAKVKTIDKISSDKAIAVADRIINVLAWSTPVDTTRAVSNWLVSLKEPNYNQIAPYHPGSFGHTHYASATEMIASGRRALQNKKPGEPIYITNNVFYIRDLNSGTSRQAPAGFVEAAVLIARKELRK